MKIDELKINSYGKLKDKELKLENGINVVFGENEKGKSTLLNFIVNMFYGTSRNKKGKEMSDYDRYKPWDTEDFSGKMMYTLDNGEKYEVFREFSKKNPKIYDKNMEDISKNYSIDKNTGSQFFLEQTKVDEQTFISSVVSFQNEVEIDNQTQNILLQKIANTSSTGDDNISYKKAIDKLNKKQLDEIGTTRSQGKPINIVINEMQNLNNVNESLKKYENYKYEIEERKYRLQDEISKLNTKYEFIQKVNTINQEEKIEKEKLKYNENKIDELEQKIQQLLEKKEIVEEDKKEVKNYEKKSSKISPYLLVSCVLLVAGIIIGVITKNYILAAIPVAIAIIVFVLALLKNNKTKKLNLIEEQQYLKIINENKDIEKNIYEINAQIQLLEKSQKEQINDAEKIKNEIIKDINAKKENLKMQYCDKIEITEINKLLISNNLTFELNKIQNMLNEKNIELHRLNLDKQNILPKLEELAENEEKLAFYNEQFEELKKKNNAINLAKEIIENAYQKMKSNVTPKFTKNLSENIAYITNKKYNKVAISEDEGILIELPSGEYKNANRLSIGTIQQLYLSFRLSMIEDISEENMPIILDEIFAYYDDNRLKETLKNIKERYSNNHQIILFTCTNREEKALKELGYEYSKIEL
ncbi:MAG: AAA family ATPase [Clostridia bacterium]|nr:AAA family ATPase [Clostridia bacterium]